MKRTLLLFTLCASLFANKGTAQNEPYLLTVFDEITFYDGYAAVVDAAVPDGVIRHRNDSYAKKLTAEQIALFNNGLTMNVTIKASCDNYDRIGNVNLAFVPKNSESYVYSEVERIEIGRYITPFMNKNLQPNQVPYVFDIDNVSEIFKDPAITDVYDIWVELELFGVPYAANNEIQGCAGRNDTAFGTLEFVSENNPNVINGDNFMMPLSFKDNLRDYTTEGTDVLGETVRTINFTLDEPLENAKFYLITSNHGAGQNGEEYVRRNHFIYVDGEQVLMYKPGGLSCEPFRMYNTQGNGIYGPSPRPANVWASFSNWCPGDKIPIRTIDMGDMAAGDHSFKIDVPDAVFFGDDGYFPFSVYLQGGAETLGSSDFGLKNYSVSPNPVTNIATINSAKQVKNVAVFNTLGQQVLTAKTKQVDFSALNSGVYFMNIQFDDNKTVTQKIIKN